MNIYDKNSFPVFELIPVGFFFFRMRVYVCYLNVYALTKVPYKMEACSQHSHHHIFMNASTFITKLNACESGKSTLSLDMEMTWPKRVCHTNYTSLCEKSSLSNLLTL